MLEEHRLRNIIANFFPQITCIFNKYKTDARLMCKQGGDICLFLSKHF